MPPRTWLAGLLGTVVMFVWIFLAHMTLGLGEAGLLQIPNEAPLLATMSSTIPAHGTYTFPNMDPKDMAGNMRKIENGPGGMLIYYPAHHFNFGAALAVEFIEELVLVFIALYLLTLTRITSFVGKIGFFTAFGLCVACATYLQFWNWYGFSGINALASCFTGVVGYFVAGMVVGWLKVGGEPTA